MKEKFDIYKQVTIQIIESMKNGDIPWRKAWATPSKAPEAFVNRATGKGYSLINCFLLGKPGQYASFRQIKDLGGNVKKGAKGKIVIYWGEYIPKENKEEAKRLEEEGKSFDHLKVKFPKFYNVFNIEEDTEGIPGIEPAAEMEMTEAENSTLFADNVITTYTINENVKVDEKECDAPEFDCETDTVTVPMRRQFEHEEDFYASVFTGLAHSTASEARLARKKELESLRGKAATVKEELIAEIASSMLLASSGLKRKETHLQQAAVCQRWIKEMENDFKLIIAASYGAEKAARYILGGYAA